MDSQRNLKKLGSPADFNIPKGLVPYLNRKIHDVGSLRLLLNQCIYKKWYLLSIPKQIPRDRIGYQKQKLELKRFSFRPFEDDWIELRRLAFLHKVSMCKMFVKLLETDLYPELKYAEKLVQDELQSLHANQVIKQKTGT
ncbi:PF07600 family protein [Leptospira borgpetersenii serovar Javanica str. UI 09931]|uniref:PF07600 family protein n=4 Tax=Leptospira borgpetersenii TaxID=174 RepID=M3GHM4_LEPBO|nr:PF07600 family protein [Leptospira borgpetersenii str. 200801926]EKQ90540.1 PF07600 family protein [Leptospira borgpetersenii str. UI 09149]EMG00467.1 PF07600 family protein [Leptospira borgpetersenii str. 200701203]EMN13341.1 PF07600 family protein [Leptospira borgpetersenii str. Brem 307]EMN17439.1 PF07600 family protein [Leptospira borgpetersenii str. Brem 328]EMN59017.1 PF07600 family protein [Leptospira borgpetersenii serovar Javanica str. MK146]ENO64915.1 PF07600 family protein [Lept